MGGRKLVGLLGAPWAVSVGILVPFADSSCRAVFWGCYSVLPLCGTFLPPSGHMSLVVGDRYTLRRLLSTFVSLAFVFFFLFSSGFFCAQVFLQTSGIIFGRSFPLSCIPQ